MFSVIINHELIAKSETLKGAWEIAYNIDPKNTNGFSEIEEEYEIARRIFDTQVEQGIKKPDEWDFKCWLNSKYNGDRIVEDTKLALKRHDDYLLTHEPSNYDIEQMLSGEMDKVINNQPVKFSAVWVIIHIILAICTGGVSILLWTLPWVIAKYQTHDNASGLGIFLFGFLYNIYRLVK